MAYDTVHGKLLVMGGSGATHYNDVWSWSGTRYELAPPPFVPTARVDAALVYDAGRGRSILFGGFVPFPDDPGGTLVGETSEWDGTRWIDRTPSDPLQSPEARRSPAMAYDAGRERVVLFGGGATNTESDTWEWDGAAWLERSPANPPSARYEHALAYDGVRERVLLFGGEHSYLNRSDETWEFDGTSWSKLTPATSPPARGRHAMAFDAARGRVVLFGGVVGVSTSSAETWEWDGSTMTWENRTPIVSPAPRARHSLVYDPVRKRIVLIGGQIGDNGPPLDDTWEWDGTSWREVQTAPLPARFGTTAGYDIARRRLLAFGGGSGTAALDDTLHLHWGSASPEEVCAYGLDGDADALVGCADGDCWGYCDPLCPPSTSCMASRPRCGDGVCTTPLETCGACAADCGACSADVCGDFICRGSESLASCPGDCS